MTLIDVLFASPILNGNSSPSFEALDASQTNEETIPDTPLAVEEYAEVNEHDKANLYGGTHAGGGYEPPSLDSLIVGMLIAITVICFCVIVPMGKAFNCGATTAALGMTGTAWGVLLLFAFIFFPWIAILLGIAFVLSNKCDKNIALQMSGLLQSPEIAYVREPLSMSSTPVSLT
jgi:uncharacterized membrane protein